MAGAEAGGLGSAYELALNGIVDGEILRARLEALVAEADIHFLIWLDRLLDAALADPRLAPTPAHRHPHTLNPNSGAAYDRG